MKRVFLATAAAALAAALIHPSAAAQSGQPKLHVNPKWKQCSLQLDSSLTQAAWHQFTEEAGLVTYFRPLTDARPMGRGRFEVSLLNWQTGIDDADAAWNDTFVHPDSTHWLIEGSALSIPGLTVRAGVTDRTDVGLYATKAFGANYGFVGGQVQQNLIGGGRGKWDAAVRGSFVSMFGPEDVRFALYGVDLVASRRMRLSRWASLSPYAGVSGYLATSHERSPVVSLRDERVDGAQGTVGVALELARARVGAEYSVAKLRALAIKVGVGL